MVDGVLLGTVALLASSVGALAFYYRRLRKLDEEYGRAQLLVGDIVTSFNKQIRSQEKQVAAITRRIMAMASKNDRLESRSAAHDGRIAELSERMTELSVQKPQFPEQQLKDVIQKITDVSNAQEKLQEKISNLESKLASPDLSIEAAIPIKQDKALASLTPTELSVLEILANEGDKTAPEIKARVNLTREHTARLMKKLYQEGYLERTTGKIPFAYRIKEEMSKILKKPEAKT